MFFRHRFSRFMLAMLATSAAAAACGSDDDVVPGTEDGGLDATTDGTVVVPDANRPDGTGPDAQLPDGAIPDGALPDGSPGDAQADVEVDANIPDGPDVPPVVFPGAVPNLFGYTLQDAYPGMFLSGAMDMEWPAGSTEPFVLQRGGHIVRLHAGTNRTLVLNFEGQVALRGEAGALGMALHPKFADPVAPQPYVYVWYNTNTTPTRQRLSRFTWNPATNRFDPASQFILVEQTEGATEHNGAHIRFGPDGFLYFANGDDTRSAQTTQRLDGGLFSGMFRIDVDMRGGAISHAPTRQPSNCVTQGYFVPNDNPFVGVANANEEYWALGFRNPYSFNFDRMNGALWIGDVGETFREEIDLVVKGGNYQWPFLEGTKRLQTGNTTIGTSRGPSFEYPHHTLGDLSAIMGAYVYRGAALPELAGKYIFSDWPTGRVWALDTTTSKRTSLYETNVENAPVGWGQDAAGELYLISWSRILKLVRAPAHTVPKKLSETKIFRNTQTMLTPTGVVPYEIRSPLWSDGAKKQRWVYVPAGQKATMAANGNVTLPPGSLLVKQFDLPAGAQPSPGRSKKLETRVLVVGTSDTYGFTYRWNAAGTDADLVIEGADEAIGDVVPAEARTWHYPSSGECWSCHRSTHRVLAFRGEQLNFNLAGGGGQLAALQAANVFDGTAASAPAPLADPADTTAPIGDRASAYLAANCSHCHRPGQSFLGGTTWNAMPGVAAASRGLLNAPHHNTPMATAFGIPGAPLVAPANPNNSILMRRVESTDPDLLMPALGRSKVDPVGSAVIRAWIQSL